MIPRLTLRLSLMGYRRPRRPAVSIHSGCDDGDHCSEARRPAGHARRGLIGLGLEQYRRAQEERQRNPVGGPKLARVRVGMPVQTIDEITLGTLVAI